MHRGAYLRTGWDILDGTIVVLSIVSLVGSSSMGFVRTLRLVRVLRPLRMISR